jgi:Type VI secretion system effector, Hcp
MNSKILVLGFACLSLVAVGQSNEKQKAAASAPVKAPRDAASGQASGKAASEQKGVVHRDLAARDAQTGKATGKTTAQDDWHQQRVAIGDVNGDGKADVTANGSAHASGNAVINTSHSNIKSPRDIATGQASGKRQHQPITIRKEVDAASPKN